MIFTNSSKPVCLGFQPSRVLALVGSPSNCSTSGGAEIFRVYFDKDFPACRVDALFVDAFALPTQFDACFPEGERGKFAYGMHLAGGDHEVLRSVML